MEPLCLSLAPSQFESPAICFTCDPLQSFLVFYDSLHLPVTPHSSPAPSGVEYPLVFVVFFSFWIHLGCLIFRDFLHGRDCYLFISFILFLGFLFSFFGFISVILQFTVCETFCCSFIFIKKKYYSLSRRGGREGQIVFCFQELWEFCLLARSSFVSGNCGNFVASFVFCFIARFLCARLT